MIQSKEVYKYVISRARSGEASLSGDELGMICPNSGCDDSGGHFSVNVNTGMYNCFKCHTSGSMAYEIACNRSEWSSVVLSGRTSLKKTSSSASSLPLLASEFHIAIYMAVHKQGKASVLQQKMAERAYRYCIGRGVTSEQIRNYQLYIKPFDNRVYFPYWDDSGNEVFYMGRAIDDVTEPKTIEPVGVEKPLFGRHVRMLTDVVVLVEGVFDHLVTPKSYALMGSSISEEQIETLVGDGIKSAFILLDPDAGEQAVRSSKKLAKRGIKPCVCLMSGDADPADIGKFGMESIVKHLMMRKVRRGQIVHI